MTGPEALVQLMSVGVVWMTVHCAGMCGPLVTGLNVGGPLRMLAYQGGRAVTYSVLGAIAGAIGATIPPAWGALVAFTLGGAAILSAIRSLTRTDIVTIGRRRGVIERLASLARPLLLSKSALRPVGLGMVLAFLPCMIAIWALGLAALTGSALWGATVMLGLVVLTTPMMLAIGFFSRFVRGARLPSIMLAVSGLWLMLVGLAGAGVLNHVHFNVAGFTVMLF